MNLFLATSIQDVRLQLVTEEAADAAKSGGNVTGSASATSFIATGLELEEQM